MLHNYFLFPRHVQHMKQCKFVIFSDTLKIMIFHSRVDFYCVKLQSLQ